MLLESGMKQSMVCYAAIPKKKELRFHLGVLSNLLCLLFLVSWLKCKEVLAGFSNSVADYTVFVLLGRFLKFPLLYLRFCGTILQGLLFYALIINAVADMVCMLERKSYLSSCTNLNFLSDLTISKHFPHTCA